MTIPDIIDNSTSEKKLVNVLNEVITPGVYDLLEEISVRRSRPFIRKYYPSAKIDGEPIKFPERKLNIIGYSLDETYQGIYEECSKTIENLILASYNIESYRKETKGLQLDLFDGLKETLLSKGWKEKDVNDYLMKLGRNESVIGILKVLLLLMRANYILHYLRRVMARPALKGGKNKLFQPPSPHPSPPGERGRVRGLKDLGPCANGMKNPTFWKNKTVTKEKAETVS